MPLVSPLRNDVWQSINGSMDCALQEHFQKEHSLWYGELLLQLDDAAARQIGEELRQLAQLTEPHVAHDLSQALPPGGHYCHGGQPDVCSRQGSGIMPEDRGVACRVICLCNASEQKLRRSLAAQGTGCFWATACPSGTWTCMGHAAAQIYCHQEVRHR